MLLNTRIAAAGLALTLLAQGNLCLAQEAGDRISAARRSGEITVRENEHLFALGRALLGNDLARVNQFRKDVVRLNPALGAGGEKITAGMRLKLPEYVRHGSAAPARAQSATAAIPDQHGDAPRQVGVGSAVTPAPTLVAPPEKASADTANSSAAPPPMMQQAPTVATTPANPVVPAQTPVAQATLAQQASPAAPSPVESTTSPLAATTPAPPRSPALLTTQTPQTSVALPPQPPATGSAIAAAAAGVRLLPLEVAINGAKQGSWILLERDGALFAPLDAFEEWRLQLPPDAQSIAYRDTTYVALAAVPEFKSRINLADQSIELVFSPQAFSATRMTREPSKRPVVSPVLPSVFLNYDVNHSSSAIKGTPVANNLGMLSEAGISTGLGVFTTSFAGRNLNRKASEDNAPRWLRLESLFTRDFPETNHTLRIGDTRTRSNLLGRDVYYGGVQYGTNFGLTPGFVSQPLPTLRGLSASQSTVELYVNDVLRQVSSVPTGPFTIDRLPGLTGGGEARLVVRDILGRETVIVQPFFTSNQLLASGLTDWQVEGGSLRRDLGSENSRYGPNFVNGTWRHGVSDQLTLDGLTAVTPQLRVAGAGITTALPLNLLGRIGAASSTEQTAGHGSQWVLGLERSGTSSSAQLQVQGATVNFRQLGQDAAVTPVKQQWSGNWSYSSGSLGSFGVGFATIERYDSERVATVSANYSVRVGERANLTLTASQALTSDSAVAVGLNLTIPLGNNYTVTAAAGRNNGREDFYVTASNTPTLDAPLGWRVLSGRQQEQDRYEGGLYFIGSRGNLSGDISTSPNQTSTRLGATGALVWTDGHLFATPRQDQSFALVEVKGYGGVGAGLGNTMLTKTDADGIALVPRLSAYQNNSVRLNAQDLPFSAAIESIELTAVPSWRSAVKVTFPVRSGRGALLKIVLEDGEPAPIGAIVQIENDKEEFFVGRRGEAYVTGLQSGAPGSRVGLKWNERQCLFDVALPPESPDEIPRIGPIKCTGVTR